MLYPMVERSPVHGQSAPADLVGWTLVQTSHRMARRFQEVFTASGLTAHQFGVLVQLSIEPGVSQAALARKILITPQSMGELLTQLANLGLVTRVPGRARGAAARVELTDTGRAALQATYPRVGAINTPEALGITPAEATALNDILHKMMSHLSSD